MLEQFYADILLPDSQLVVATLDGKAIRHYVLDDSSEVIPFLSSKDEFSTYHSLGAYQGLPVGYIEKVKGLQGCTGVRSFAFDFDVGIEKGKYNSLEEAYTSLAQAIEQGHVPEPTWLVMTGSGLQATWVLGGRHATAGLPEGLWTTCFQSMRAHLNNFLKIDPTVGTLPYRLLRSPCTLNWKYEPPVQPVILNEQRGPYLDAAWFRTLKKVVKKKLDKVSNKGDSDRVRVPNPVGLAKVVEACAAMREQQETQGADTLEPQWMATANICAHTREYRMAFHDLSKGHSEYDIADTDAKFDHVASNAMAGPMGCEHFGSPSDPDSPCHGCWAAKRGLTNPISATRQFGKPQVAGAAPKAAPKAIQIPEEEDEDEEAGFDVEQLDGISEEVPELEEAEENADEDDIPYRVVPKGQAFEGWHLTTPKGIPLCYRFWVGQPVRDPATGNGGVQISADGKKWEILSIEEMITPQLLKKKLFQMQIGVTDSTVALQYISNMAYSAPDLKALPSYDSYGWNDSKSMLFTPGGTVGTLEAFRTSSLDTLHKRWGGRSGTLEAWMSAIDIYGRQGQEPYLMAVLASLASPVLNFAEMEKGVMYSMAGTGGIGKTTALAAASSVWGKPVDSLMGAASTYNALRNVLSRCGHLPMIFDDITQMDPEHLKELALQISQGEGRTRSSISGTADAGESWQLVFITTTNQPLQDTLSSVLDKGYADMDRVLEVRPGPSVHVSPVQGAKLKQDIQRNFGTMGSAFGELLLRLGPDKAREALNRIQDGPRFRGVSAGNERYCRALVAACYLVHRLIKREYPAFPGDPETHLDWMLEQIKDNRNIVDSLRDETVLDVSDLVSHYIIGDKMLRPTAGTDIYTSTGRIDGDYMYEYEEYYLISNAQFNQYCNRRHVKARNTKIHWGAKGSLVDHSYDGGPARYTRKPDRALTIDGNAVKGISYLYIRREKVDEEARRQQVSGTVTPIGQASKAH